MAWKLRRNNKDKMSSSVGLPSVGVGNSFNNPALKKLPKRSCLRGGSLSLDSDWSSNGSSTSSHRSDTYRCDHSSSYNSFSAPSKSCGSSLEPNQRPTSSSSQASQSLDATRVSSAAGINLQELSSSACNISSGGGHTQRSQRSTHRSQSSVSSSQKSKNVSFSVVEIRDYEREVADNPSCSSGPPIGIGWSHLDSRVVHLSSYEMSRPYRKGQLELVLTREEREALLAEWGVSSSEMILSTRALNKAKNQRRQTVRNLDKAQRVEEGIESATRKIKRMLTNKKSTRAELEELQRQADIAAVLAPARFEAGTSHEDDLDSEQRPERRSLSDVHPNEEITEKEGNVLESFEVKLPTYGVMGSKSSTDNSKARTVPTTADDVDAISCISGFTLGNSTTASAKEIEKFHRELEIELFGDQELPSMVGQTLEVDVDIPEEEKVFHDPAPHCGVAEPPSVAIDFEGDGSTVPTQQQEQDRTVRSPMGYPQSDPVQPNMVPERHVPIQNYYSYNDDQPYGNRSMLSQGCHQIPAYKIGMGGNSLDSSGIMSRHAPFQAPERSSVPPQSRLVDCIPYASPSTMRRDWNCTTTDGPRVTHMPLASLSPNNWMEGPTRAHQGTSRSAWEAVTISEDNSFEIQMEQNYVEQRPEHIFSVLQ